METSNTQRNIPKWLKRLQENSWEMEMLISGGAIFSLFQISDIYIDWIQSIRMMNHLPGAGILLMIGQLGLKILTMGFVLHLVSRGFWLALVCINDVFPEGYKWNRIKWKKPFKEEIKESTDLQDQIVKVDKVCGTIMYLSIVAAFAIVGFAICIVFISFFYYLAEDGDLLDRFAYTLLILFGVYLLDFLTFGLLRKIPYLSYVLYPIFKGYDFLSLRKHYQESLWVFSTNINKFKFALTAIVFLFLAANFTLNSLYQVMHWPNVLDSRDYRNNMADEAFMVDMHYMDQWSPEKTFSYGIESKLVHTNFMEIYFSYPKALDVAIRLIENPEDRSLENIITVSIDDEEVDVNWLPIKKYDSRVGITAMLDLSELKDGRHNLTYDINEEIKEEYEQLTKRLNTIIIPFWIDRKVNQVKSEVTIVKSN